jgi:hypothetical protein
VEDQVAALPACPLAYLHACLPDFLGKGVVEDQDLEAAAKSVVEDKVAVGRQTATVRGIGSLLGCLLGRVAVGRWVESRRCCKGLWAACEVRWVFGRRAR